MAVAITHTGVITSINSHGVVIKIAAPTASECGCCPIVSFCSKPVEVELSYKEATESLIGRKVKIKAEAGIKPKATILLFIIPLLIIVAALFGGDALGWSQLTSGVISIALAAVWFLFLYLFRRNFDGSTKFEIVELF